MFNAAAPGLQDFFSSLGASTPHALELAFIVGLAVAILLIAAIYLGARSRACRPCGTSGAGGSRGHWPTR